MIVYGVASLFFFPVPGNHIIPLIHAFVVFSRVRVEGTMTAPSFQDAFSAPGNDFS